MATVAPTSSITKHALIAMHVRLLTISLQEPVSAEAVFLEIHERGHALGSGARLFEQFVEAERREGGGLVVLGEQARDLLVSSSARGFIGVGRHF